MTTYRMEIDHDAGEGVYRVTADLGYGLVDVGSIDADHDADAWLVLVDGSDEPLYRIPFGTADFSDALEEAAARITSEAELRKGEEQDARSAS